MKMLLANNLSKIWILFLFLFNQKISPFVINSTYFINLEEGKIINTSYLENKNNYYFYYDNAK